MADNAQAIKEGACHQVAEEQLAVTDALLKFLPTALSKKADCPKQKSGSPCATPRRRQ
jgi:hypothetical protein